MGDREGRTALDAMLLSTVTLDVTKYLISQGAEVNKGDNEGRTAVTQCYSTMVILMSPNISSVKELR